MCQTEACLNSRPLCPVNEDPNSLIAMTPGHFLIGDAPLSHPEPELERICLSKRWRICQGLVQQFWRCWSGKYLSRLQHRPKSWSKPAPNVRVDQLVLIKDERRPPTQWLLGRIIEVQPGTDNLVRVATVKTAKSGLKRPISKISLHPIEDSELEGNALTNLPL